MLLSELMWALVLLARVVGAAVGVDVGVYLAAVIGAAVEDDVDVDVGLLSVMLSEFSPRRNCT